MAWIIAERVRPSLWVDADLVMNDGSEGAALCMWPGALSLIAASYQFTATEGS